MSVFRSILIAFVLLIQSSGIDARIITLTPDKPLTQQIIKKKTIYLVRNDFDLCGQDLYLPPKITLRFVGGSFYNGTVHGNKSLLEGDIKCFTNIFGTFANKVVKTNWFIKDSTKTNLCALLAQLINTNITTIKISKGVYPVSNTVILKEGLSLIGEEGCVIALDRSQINGKYCLFVLNGSHNKKGIKRVSDVSLKDLHFNINGSCYEGMTCILRANYATKVSIRRCLFVDYVNNRNAIAPYSDSMIEFFNCDNCTVDSCYTKFVRLIGSYNGNSLLVTNNRGYNTHGTWLECNDGSNNIFEGNSIIGNMLVKNSTISQNATYGIIRGNYIEVNDVESDSMINLGHGSTAEYSNSPRGCVVEDNHLKTNICKGIVVWGNDATNIIIKDNVIESSGTWCIYTLLGTKDISIMGNSITVEGGNQSAVYCRTENCSIVDNRIRNSNGEILSVKLDPAIAETCFVKN